MFIIRPAVFNLEPFSELPVKVSVYRYLKVIIAIIEMPTFIERYTHYLKVQFIFKCLALDLMWLLYKVNLKKKRL